jgi:hypothetical protein
MIAASELPLLGRKRSSFICRRMSQNGMDRPCSRPYGSQSERGLKSTRRILPWLAKQTPQLPARLASELWAKVGDGMKG